MLNAALVFAFACIGLALLLNLVRLVRGPDPADRILALDTMYINTIALLIVYTAYDIFKNAIDKMVDRSCVPAESDKMRTLIEKEAGVAHIDRLQTRMFGSRIFVDVEVSAADSLTLLESHRIAENIHLAIEKNFPDVKHCMVHINPVSELHHDF